MALIYYEKLRGDGRKFGAIQSVSWERSNFALGITKLLVAFFAF